MVRSGSHGEYEKQFLQDKRIYFQWEHLEADLSAPSDKDQMFELLKSFYANEGDDRVWNWTRQAWQFAKDMQPNDWVVMPSKLKPAIHIGRITGAYKYLPTGEERLKHSRTIDWFAQDIPRSNFDQDLLYSFGAFLTVCRISRNDAEARVKAMAQNQWKSTLPATVTQATQEAIDPTANAVADIEQVAQDGIAKLIAAKFKGHGLARLVDAVLKAQGYTTHLSPPGPDKGIDILAAPGALGFGKPRICVQVKSEDQPADSATLNQLIGAMQNVQADQGLLVSWSGFKSSVDKETPAQFFRVRLWDQSDVIAHLLEHYDKLDEDFRAELPLKRVWTVAYSEDTA
jgi:restriction system protein